MDRGRNPFWRLVQDADLSAFESEGVLPAPYEDAWRDLRRTLCFRLCLPFRHSVLRRDRLLVLE